MNVAAVRFISACTGDDIGGKTTLIFLCVVVGVGCVMKVDSMRGWRGEIGGNLQRWRSGAWMAIGDGHFPVD